MKRLTHYASLITVVAALLCGQCPQESPCPVGVEFDERLWQMVAWCYIDDNGDEQWLHAFPYVSPLERVDGGVSDEEPSDD